MGKEKFKLPPSLLEQTPWPSGANPLWPASVFTLRRNVAKYNFPPKISPRENGQVLELLKNGLLACVELNGPLFFNAEELSPLEKEFLFEHFLSLESFQNATEGQGVALEASGRLLALVNVQDHLQLHLLDGKGEWEKAWNLLTKIESSLASKTDFAYSKKFGFLTADPNLCGTGLVVHLYLHLPALIRTGQLSEVLIKQKEEEVEAISMEGNLEEIVGDILVLRNAYTLGLSEEKILHALHGTAMKLTALEKALRAELKTKNDIEIRDQISRAYGLLLHSYKLQTKEVLGALSLLKLGVDLGWVSGIADAKINEIFFKCRHSHLAHLFPEKAGDQNELAHRRAELLHQALQGVTLSI